jgi:hypothetical protein
MEKDYIAVKSLPGLAISRKRQLYAPQTKILEGGTKDEIRIFAALFNPSGEH